MKIRSLMGSIVLAAALLASAGASAQGIVIDQSGVRVLPPDSDMGPPRTPPGHWNRDSGENGYENRGIGQREARRIARGAGMVDTYGVDRRGPMWIVEGTDRRGRGLRVTISARSGDIVNVDRARRG